MSAATQRVRRTVAGLAAGSLALAGTAIGFAAPAAAVEGFELTRLQGVDRWATAAAIARAGFPDASVVLLANGQSDDKSTARNEGHFPDALAGNYLAGARSAPTLLTTETSLPAATLTALDDIDPQTVIILGGTSAVSEGQADQLRNRGYTVQRVFGQDRYETAAAVAKSQALTYVGTVDGDRTAVVANGQNFPDALVAGPLGYAGKLPLTITDPQKLSSATREALQSLEIDHVLIPGGTAAVSESVASEIRALGISVQRFAGTGREQTATLVADYAVAELDFVETHVNLASGADFPDALTGGPHAGKEQAAILLTPKESLHSVTRAWIEAHNDTLEAGHIFGGTAAVSAAVEGAAEQAGQGDGTAPVTVTITNSSVEQGKQVTGSITGDAVTSATVSGCGLTNEPVGDTSATTDGIQFAETIPATQPVGNCTLTFTVTLEDNTTETVTKTITVTAPPTNQDFTISPAGDKTAPASSGDTGRMEFTVSGIDASTTTVDIALIPCEYVSRSGDVVAFRDSDGVPNQADGVDGTTNDTPANIETINGQPNNSNLGDDEFADDVPVTGSSIKFTVDSAVPECVVAVVFADADNDDSLDVDSNDKPTEQFAATGELTFQPGAAEDGEMDENVESTDKANDRFVGCELAGDAGAADGTDPAVSSTDCQTFSYDSNDQYYVNSISATNRRTMAQFEALLSPDDDVSGVYVSEPSLSSQFILFDEAPLPPEAVTVATTASSVTLTIDDSATATVDAYNIYRSTSSTGACPNGTSNRIATVADPTTSSDASTITFVDSAVTPNTTYCYRVTSLDDGDESAGSTSSADGGIARTTSGETTRPRILDAEVVEGTFGLPGRLDEGDEIYLCVDEPLAPPNAGDTIRVSNGTSGADIENGGNADFALGTGTSDVVSTGTTTTRSGAAANTCPATQTLVVTITTTVLDDRFPPQPVAIPTTILSTSGVTDPAGNEIDLANSKDKVIDEEEGEENVDPETGDPAPKFSSANVINAQTLDVTYTKQLDCTSVAPGGFDYLLQVKNSAGQNTQGDASDFDVTCAGNEVTFVLIPTRTFEGAHSITVDKFDPETVLDTRGVDQPDSDTLTISGPAFVSAVTSAGSNELTVTYDKDVLCSTVEASGQDYRLTIIQGAGAGEVTDASFDAACIGTASKTVTLTLTGAGAFQSGQQIRLDKVDAEVVHGTNQLEQLESDAITFTVA